MIDIEADEATTPPAARRLAGRMLKEARIAADLSLDAAAEIIQRSAPTLSRLERGLLQKPRLADVTPLVDRYQELAPHDVDDSVRDRILRLTQQGAEPVWFSKFRDVLGGPMTANDAQRYIEYENDAAVVRSFEPEAVPGLLQTAGYARAITDVFHSAYSPAERLRFVELRLARQQVLDRPGQPLRLDVVIGELALRRQVVEADVMREQVQLLLDADERSNVSVRIAPIELGHPAVYGGPFVVMDLADENENGVVYLETRGDPQFMDSDDSVDHYRRLHSDLSGAAPSAAQSRALLEEILKSLS